MTTRRRVLLVIHAFPPDMLGGSEVHAADLAAELAHRFDVSVFAGAPASGGNARVDVSSRGPVTLYRLFRPSPPADLRAAYESNVVATAFSSVLEDVRPQVVHFHGVWGLSNDLPGISRRIGAVNVFTLHDFWLMCPRGQRLQHPDQSICWNVDRSRCARCLEPWIAPARLPSAGRLLGAFRGRQLADRTFWRRAAARVFRSAPPVSPRAEVDRYHAKTADVVGSVDLFIAPSAFLRSEFIRYGVAETQIIHSDNGIDTRTLTCAKSRSTTLRFGFVGSLIPSKGVHVLLESFKQASLDADLLIFGAAPDPHSTYASDLHERGRHPRIHFKGRFERERTADVFADIDVLVVPSLWFENSPLVIKEAFAAGTPVIASRLGGMAEQIVSGTSGILVTPGSVDELARAITAIGTSTSLRVLLSQGVPRVKTIAAHAIELGGIYDQLYHESQTSGRSGGGV